MHPQIDLAIRGLLVVTVVYSNTLMTSLNSRAVSSSRRSQQISTTTTGVRTVSTVGPPSATWAPRSFEEGGRRAIIHVSRETEIAVSPSPCELELDSKVVRIDDLHPLILLIFSWTGFGDR